MRTFRFAICLLVLASASLAFSQASSNPCPVKHLHRTTTQKVVRSGIAYCCCSATTNNYYGIGVSQPVSEKSPMVAYILTQTYPIRDFWGDWSGPVFWFLLVLVSLVFGALAFWSWLRDRRALSANDRYVPPATTSAPPMGDRHLASFYRGVPGGHHRVVIGESAREMHVSRDDDGNPELHFPA